MRLLLLFTLLSGCAAPPSASPVAAERDLPTLGRVVVLDFKPASEAEVIAAERATGQAQRYFARDVRAEVVGLREVATALGRELEKEAAGCDDVACIAELAGQLGADIVLAGEVSTLGKYTVLSLRLVDIKATRVVARSLQRGPAGEGAPTEAHVEAAVVDLVGQLAR